MDFFDVVEQRRSTRAFSTRPIEPDKTLALLEAVNRAPSAGNLQAYEVYLVRNQAVKAALAAAALEQRFIAAAPVVLVFCAQDATIACTFAMLAATALGLASVWVGAFRTETVRQAVGAAPGIVPVAILPVGYAAETPRPTSRRPLSELVHEVA